MRLGEYALAFGDWPSNCASRRAVSARSVSSPAVVPYCNGGWPVFPVRSISAIMSRVISTGSDGLSVNPAANEISPGRTKASRISQVIGGSAVRWPSCDSALPFIRASRMG